MEYRFSTLRSGQQHRAEPAAIGAATIAAARVEQPSVGTKARITATPEPTIAPEDEVGVVATPGLVVVRDRLVLLSFV